MTSAPDTNLPRPRRTSAAAVRLLLGAVIFGSGMAAGWGLTTYLDERRSMYYRQHPEEQPRRMAQRLGDRLELTGDQTRQVEAALRQHWPEFQQVRREMFPRMNVIMERCRQDLADVLSDQQKQKWDAYIGDMTRNWQAPAAATTTAPANAPATAPAAP